jgi:hypothetical protein
MERKREIAAAVARPELFPPSDFPAHGDIREAR